MDCLNELLMAKANITRFQTHRETAVISETIVQIQQKQRYPEQIHKIRWKADQIFQKTEYALTI